MDPTKCCQVITVTVIVTLCISVTDSCFIRSCPRGGRKRGMDIVSLGTRAVSWVLLNCLLLAWRYFSTVLTWPPYAESYGD